MAALGAIDIADDVSRIERTGDVPTLNRRAVVSGANRPSGPGSAIVTGTVKALNGRFAFTRMK